MKQLLSLFVLTAVLCGCARFQDLHWARYSWEPFVIYDNCYDDFLLPDGNWGEFKNARVMHYAEASDWLYDFRSNERGEYADRPASEWYPVEIEATSDTGTQEFPK